MKAQRLGGLVLLTLLIGLALLFTLAAAAQGPEGSAGSHSAPFQYGDGAWPLSRSVAPGEGGAQSVHAPTVELGEPGLSFRYVETLGETEVPYLVDAAHTNRPWGLFTDSSDNLYIVEERGFRLLRYNSTGTNTLVIGKPGVCYTDDYGFCIPQDVALDGSGNIWVADGNRVVQYDATGTFLQQQPATKKRSAKKEKFVP